VAAHVHLTSQEGDFLAQFFIVSEVFWCGRESENGRTYFLPFSLSLLYYYYQQRGDSNMAAYVIYQAEVTDPEQYTRHPEKSTPAPMPYRRRSPAL